MLPVWQIRYWKETAAVKTTVNIGLNTAETDPNSAF